VSRRWPRWWDASRPPRRRTRRTSTSRSTEASNLHGMTGGISPLVDGIGRGASRPSCWRAEMADDALRRSRALWNRTRCDLENHETLAQILDRGEIEVWRDVYRRTKSDASPRQRIARIVVTGATGLHR